MCNANADEVRMAREDDEAVRKAVAIGSRRISLSFKKWLYGHAHRLTVDAFLVHHVPLA